MPVENERKYVLDMSLVNTLPHYLSGKEDVLSIRQAYVMEDDTGVVRIRCTYPKHDIGFIEYILCVKKLVNHQVIEVETPISINDFNSLWSIATNKLQKTRYVLKFPEKWEIDFFHTDVLTYFVMAEHEMPPGQKEPEYIPRIIFDNLLYAVPQESNSLCSSKLLGSPERAMKILNDIQELNKGFNVHKSNSL